MKKGKLELIKDSLSEEIKEKGLIKKCWSVALLGKQTYFKERDYSTHFVWEYGSNENLGVRYEGGIYVMGGGKKLDVYFHGEEVFKVRDNPTRKDEKYPENFIKVDEDFVMVYSPGLWESEMEELLTEISKDEVNLMKKNFPSLNLED